MKLSRSAKATVAAGAAVSLVLYLIVVDLGVNAGRVHYRVRGPGGESLGGLTLIEVREVLTERARLLESGDITFVAGELGPLRFTPQQVGWRPRINKTAARAMAVGREDGPLRSLVERVRAWFAAVKVSWAGSLRRRKIERVLDAVESDAAARDLVLKRRKLRRKMKHAIVSWPRKRFYRLPVHS